MLQNVARVGLYCTVHVPAGTLAAQDTVSARNATQLLTYTYSPGAGRDGRPHDC